MDNRIIKALEYIRITVEAIRGFVLFLFIMEGIVLMLIAFILLTKLK